MDNSLLILFMIHLRILLLLLLLGILGVWNLSVYWIGYLEYWTFDLGHLLEYLDVFGHNFRIAWYFKKFLLSVRCILGRLTGDAYFCCFLLILELFLVFLRGVLEMRFDCFRLKIYSVFFGLVWWNYFRIDQ